MEVIMEIEARKDDKALIVSVKGKMDATTAPEFEKKISEFISQGDNTFVIELVDLDYISSAGLRSILSTTKKLKASDGKLLLAALKGVVKEVFEISGFNAIIPIYDTTEAALSEI